ncbi:ABC transporter ATP-binding protein [Clostridium sp. SYSU_GA19001]|uniref:ABC transporter ATP-binding protein n=1 Tax=Clostridium caldaquaticum TaxID=2940653 RepID=UPI0020771182|nr:ABC transporter ATP-binding protein [Clostridium caldaquaticum]MCM8711471.1 ABC transporter ATP-binding protein [Clostridium caldaquaticum]
MIQIENLVKRYGQNVILNGLNLTVNKGEILGFLGPNGAGKSTTMNIITGYISATEGNVKIDGLDILEHPKAVKKKIGYLPEIPPLYTDMTVEEYLKFVCKIKKIERDKIFETIERVADIVKVSHYRNRLIKNLSKGYKQRVGLAQAIIGNPELLILDEPTVGLDPKEIIEIRNLIKELGKNHTVILSSHILSEVSAVCDRVVIINKGQIVVSGTPEELSKKLSYNNKMLLRIKGNGKEVSRMLNDINEVEKVEIQNTVENGTIDILVVAKQDKDIRETLFWKLSKAEVPVLMMKPVDLSLEEVFLQVTTQ